MRNNLIEHIENSINNAINHKSKLNEEILLLKGYSSRKNRHLLNNIVNMPNVNYLEIGVYMGSTFISSLYQNNVNSAYAIDNWSEFGENRNVFTTNCYHFNVNNFEFFENDSFKVDLSKIKNKINVYFYDGNHSEESSCNALTYYYSVLDDEFILIVDDFDWENPQHGIRRGIKECGLEIIYEQHLKSNGMNDIDTWWNGIYVSILKKQ